MIRLAEKRFGTKPSGLAERLERVDSSAVLTRLVEDVATVDSAEKLAIPEQESH